MDKEVRVKEETENSSNGFLDISGHKNRQEQLKIPDLNEVACNAVDGGGEAGEKVSEAHEKVRADRRGRGNLVIHKARVKTSIDQKRVKNSSRKRIADDQTQCRNASEEVKSDDNKSRRITLDDVRTMKINLDLSEAGLLKLFLRIGEIDQRDKQTPSNGVHINLAAGSSSNIQKNDSVEKNTPPAMAAGGSSSRRDKRDIRDLWDGTDDYYLEETPLEEPKVPLIPECYLTEEQQLMQRREVEAAMDANSFNDRHDDHHQTPPRCPTLLIHDQKRKPVVKIRPSSPKDRINVGSTNGRGSKGAAPAASSTCRQKGQSQPQPQPPPR